MTTIEKAHKFDYTDVMFWIGLLIILLWAIGKSFGLI